MSDKLDFAGVAPCGCLKIWASYKLMKKTLAKETAKIITTGLDLRRMSTSDARKMPTECELCRPEKT